MAWEVVKSLNIEIGSTDYKVCVSNTGFNLLFEIYEPFFGRIFFGTNYWPEISEALKTLALQSYKNQRTDQIDVYVRGDKKKKVSLSARKNKIKIACMQADEHKISWIIDSDTEKRGGNPQKIIISITSAKDMMQLKEFVKQLDQLYKMIENGKIKKPEFGGYGLFYPKEMEKHDRSMLAFKVLLDDSKFSCFLRLDENKNKSDDEVKIARAKVASEARKKGLSFLEEKRGDDGFISYNNTEIVYDWEIRRDWHGNYNNIAIRYIDRKKLYHAVEFPPPNPGKEKHPLSSDYPNLIDVINFIKKNKLSQKDPYFIYKTLGQFARKINKPEIVLSIQCSQAAPVWPTLESSDGYFVAAWHIDFKLAGTVMRTTGNNAGERGEYYDCENYGIFAFNRTGIKKFKDSIIKQFSGGITKDVFGNVVPKVRKWI